MTPVKICLLEKKRGNYLLQERYTGKENVVDGTSNEVKHHFNCLREAGYEVVKLKWSENFITDIKKLDFDIVFNVSSIVESSILEELGIPYVGSDIFGIIKATDKSLAKEIWSKNNLSTSDFIVVKSTRDCEIFEKLPPVNFPLFLKPVAGRGSSGIDESSVIHSYEDLIEGVDARIKKIGQPVLVEKYLEGREITCGIIGNGNRIRALPLLEIEYKKGDNFLTFDKKEADNDLFHCPARIPPETEILIKELAINAFRSLNLRDFGRVDTILTENGPYLLEINSFAGLMCTPREKPHSYMGFMAVAEEKSGAEFLDEIVKEALKRTGIKRT
ncbi:MAG: ATP-grasp domain-containing protein [Candidatus Hodarchaeota archaeon]